MFKRHTAISAPLVVTVVLLSVFAAGTRLKWDATTQQPSKGRSEPTQQFTAVDAGLKGVRRSDLGLSIDQVLNASLSQPGVHGIVRGTVGAPSATELPNPDNPQFRLLATEFPLLVQAFLGRGPSPYPIGKTVTLRVPGGTVGARTVQAEDAPQVKQGEDLYVFLRDPGPFFENRWGRNGSNLVVAVDAVDVFEVRNGVVHGQGTDSALAEPVAVFEQHFAH